VREQNTHNREKEREREMLVMDANSGWWFWDEVVSVKSQQTLKQPEGDGEDQREYNL